MKIASRLRYAAVRTPGEVPGVNGYVLGLFMRDADARDTASELLGKAIPWEVVELPEPVIVTVEVPEP